MLIIAILTAVFLTTSHLASAMFFASNPLCGFNNSDDFLNFEQSSVFLDLRPLGVCSWGFNFVMPPPSGITGTIDQCLQCVLVPASDACPTGLSNSMLDITWDLAPASGCQLMGCLDVECPPHSLARPGGAMCPNGVTAVACCPYVAHSLCCTTLQCEVEATPGGSCLSITGNQDLLPGQVLDIPR